MSDFTELQIHTVYSATDTGGRPSSALRMLALSTLTLFVGITWLYATWNPAWKWIENEFMFGEIILNVVGSHTLAPTPQPAAEPGAAPTPAPKPPRDTPESKAARAAATRQAQNRLGQITVGWLGFTTVVGLWLVMSGSSGLLRSRVLGLLGMLLVPILIGLIVWLGFHVQEEYAWLESILPKWVYPTFGALGLALAISAGLVLQRWRVALLRIGGVLVILSAFATVGGIWAALRWGGLPAEAFSTAFYVKAFAAQSAYGWLLLIGTIKLR